jgi:hypothetical protein
MGLQALRKRIGGLMADLKVDLERTWLRATTLWAAVVLTAWVTMLYVRTGAAIETIQTTIQMQLVPSIKEVRDELRQLAAENVSIRQIAAWMDLYQITVQAWTDKMRSENPNLKISDLKVPALPR